MMDRRISISWQLLTAALLFALAFAPASWDRAWAASGEAVLVANTGQRDFGEVDALRHRPAISADGRFVAYVPQSAAEGDPLFLRDMTAAAPEQIVTPSNPAFPGFDNLAPALSASGRYLAFASEEPTLTDEDNDPTQDVFRYDRLTGRMVLVSRSNGRRGRAGRSDSGSPSISADGRFVAFGTSSNLAPGDRNGGNVYVRDLATEANRPAPARLGRAIGSPDISGDGRKLAFLVSYRIRPRGHALPTPGRRDRRKEVVLADLRGNGAELASRASGARGAIAKQDCGEASVSRDGRFVAFVSQAGNLARGDDNRVEDVFVRDLRRNVTTLVSRRGSHGPVGKGESVSPSISADGRFVAFLSLAPLLPEDGDDEGPDVYVKDLRTHRLTLLTRGLRGEPSNGRFGAPAISATGRFVAFGSTSSNFSPAVTSHRMSFFRYQLRR